jgi:hypothetical protein
VADTTLFATLRESWRQVLSDSDHADGRLPAFLLALTLVTGLVDAFSYLVLGHVFVGGLAALVLVLALALTGGLGAFVFLGPPHSLAGGARTRRSGLDAAATPTVGLVRSEGA